MRKGDRVTDLGELFYYKSEPESVVRGEGVNQSNKEIDRKTMKEYQLRGVKSH